MQTKCELSICGTLPKECGVSRAELKEAAAFFVSRSSRRCGVPFRRVDVILHGDAQSAQVHEAINGVKGPTDVVTQPYEPIPGEEPGVYGEIYVNCRRAISAAPDRKGWGAANELLLYVAHGIDHLSGAEDIDPKDRAAMRRRELRWLKDLGGLK